MIWSIAHQGGWDEVLMFAIPIALAVLLIRTLERRSRAITPQDQPDQEEPGSQ